MLSLTPVMAATVPGKICGEPAPLYGTVEFKRNCDIPGGVKLPPSGTPVRYRRCNACGFLFTDAFDGWSLQLGLRRRGSGIRRRPAVQQCGRRGGAVRRAQERAARA